MSIKLPLQLRFLGPSFSATRLPPMKSLLSVTSSRGVPILSRIFPFRLKYVGFGPYPNSQVGVRRFSTRPFRPRHGSGSQFRRGERDRGDVGASKSLIEDEAELSDWVSELSTSSFRGRVTDGESDSDISRDRVSSGRDRDRGQGRNREIGRERGRDRDGFSTKRRRNDISDEFGQPDRRRPRGQADSFSRNSRVSKRYDIDREKFTFQRKKVSNTGIMNGTRGDGGVNSGFRRDVKGLREQRGFCVDEEDDRDIDDNNGDERKELMGRLQDLADEEESDDLDEDDHDNDILKINESSSFGLDGKDRPSSPGNFNSYLSESRFDQCSISPLSLKGIKDAGYEKMTVVQEATLPVILKGKDVLAKAKTGTGKTVAFLLPAIEIIVKSPPISRDQKRPPILVLVICPTRELASQAAAEANTLLKYHPSIGAQVVMGGTRLALEQKQMQANPCQILVATPGRLRDHTENTAGFATRLMGVKVLVLDEADRLLDMGFRKDIEKIIAAIPKQRQTLLFSATVPEEVRQICHFALKRDHKFINTVEEGAEETNSQVRQTHLVAPLDKHFPLLYVLLKDHIADNIDFKVIIFCTTAMVTRMVADLLGELSLNVREIHSRKSQSYRTKVSDEFRKSNGLILVTSDVSARGVDYPDVTLVIQVGLPSDREQYIHRLGRTGRKGKEGQGILLLAPWEESFLSTIKELPITKASVPSVDPETKKKVERALSRVEMKSKEAAYQAWLGYYNSSKLVGRDKYRLVELANEFSRSMGLDNPPAIPKLVLGKMGLRNIPGLRSK
ncbi:hypothetical protein JCGZ_14271 [Jatropha curcas]|uniref:ATP-dependent RNA helicase n=1 Tax=Jatropha curcas TaxID=180498 RepID=A0A067K887_JATCU|nr:DEAD-box ATP-dependent RNA helicase 31 [Jatropha curcas]XP_037496600.1 DEAD-box ATP-dependent RNA helicase 31 [Jatropha curcas]KDP28500.1 hypothetical protein JCGZ_14271 [Jatropha curcas]